MARDYYAVLGVARNAGEKEIRQAFRRLARKHHPDLNPGNREAEQQFKEINEAYEVLSDPERRRLYDRYGDQWKAAQQAAVQNGGRVPPREDVRVHFGGESEPFTVDDVDFSDLLGGFFGRGGQVGGRRRVRVPAELSLEEAYRGVARVARIPDRRGERRIEVAIPPGVDTGSQVRVTPDANTEVTVEVTVRPHSQFRRTGDDLHLTMRVPVDELALGQEVLVPTLKGRVALRVPPGTQAGQVFRLSGQGMPRLHAKDVHGDLYVTLEAMLPSHLGDRERELFEQLRGLRTGKGVKP